jgi:4-amino-4-deoxy-L-arabinose transferase-like glycosyltransferase
VRRRLLTLCALAALTSFAGLGRGAISESDEAFYAEAGREMIESGDWLTPHFNYQDRWQKPILYYWLTAAMYDIGGATEWAARFWSAMAGLGLVLVTWSASRRLLGDDRGAWLAGAITATCYGYFEMARNALPDLPLALCITVTVVAALAAVEASAGARAGKDPRLRWSLLSGLAAGLGFLLKGPVAVAVPVIVLLPILWLERRETTAPHHMRTRDVAAALSAFLLVSVPWYLAMTMTHGMAYLQSFFVTDNLERFATDRFNDPRPLWFYVPIVVGGMMPWAAYLICLPRVAVTELLRRRRRLTRAERRLLIWAVFPLVFFTLSVGKQPRYVLPVLPPIAILLGNSLVKRLDGMAMASTRGRRDLSIATWVTAVTYVVLAMLLLRARSLFVTAYPWATSIAVILMVTSGAGLAWLALTRAWNRLPSVMAATATVVLLSAQFGALVGMRPEPIEEMAGLVQTNRAAGERVGEFDVFERNLIFYTRFPQVDLANDESAIAFMKSPDRVLLVVEAGDLNRLEAASGVTMSRLGQVRNFNTANVKLGSLLRPNPSQDIQTVYLVANR